MITDARLDELRRCDVRKLLLALLAMAVTLAIVLVSLEPDPSEVMGCYRNDDDTLTKECQMWGVPPGGARSKLWFGWMSEATDSTWWKAWYSAATAIASEIHRAEDPSLPVPETPSK